MWVVDRNNGQARVFIVAPEGQAGDLAIGPNREFSGPPSCRTSTCWPSTRSPASATPARFPLGDAIELAHLVSLSAVTIDARLPPVTASP